VVADEMLDAILADLAVQAGNRVSVLVNSLGATPLEELYILFARVAERLDKLAVQIVMPLVGRYATSMEMTGASLTILMLDPELEELLKAPAECAFWKVGRP
jgi:phosphoenolpyruvate---glycerone phosphotransferase subunit DhaK